MEFLEFAWIVVIRHTLVEFTLTTKHNTTFGLAQPNSRCDRASSTVCRSKVEPLISLSTSAVAVRCSSASSRSRVRWSSCLCRSAMDARAAGALRALCAPARPGFPGFLLPPRRFMSPPPAVHDHGKSYANLGFRATPEGIGTRCPNVRFGSKADIRSAKRHVRFTPKSGHSDTAKNRCPLCANSGHFAFYSITSSARSSSGSGTLRPSAFAVLRLIAGSNTVGCIAGKSAGFAPYKLHRIVILVYYRGRLHRSCEKECRTFRRFIVFGDGIRSSSLCLAFHTILNVFGNSCHNIKRSPT